MKDFLKVVALFWVGLHVLALLICIGLAGVHELFTWLAIYNGIVVAVAGLGYYACSK